MFLASFRHLVVRILKLIFTMNETIELLSSMSPKIKQKYANFKLKKGATVLALKKHIRRSSIWDKSVKTIKNENLNIVESSTSVSSKSSSSVQLVRLKETPIIISDSDLSEDGTNEVETLLENKKDLQKSVLSDNRICEIQHWIDNVDTDKVSLDVSRYTELSTIYGDGEDEDFKPKERGNAVNSTFADTGSRKFNELFKIPEQKHDNKTSLDEEKNTNNEISKSFHNLIIDDSLDESLSIRLHEKVTVRRKYNNEVPEIETNKSLISNTKNEEYSNVNSDKKNLMTEEKTTFKTDYNVQLKYVEKHNYVDDESEVHSLLDSFYGSKWREKQDLVLARTEPKKRTKKIIENLPQTERKAKQSLLYKNPYLDNEKSKSQSLLQNLHKSRLKLNTATPLLDRLKKLGDSDSQSSFSTKQSDEDICPRLRLSFNDSIDEYQETEKRTSKYFEDKIENINSKGDKVSNKENFNISDLGESLESRIRRKMFNINDRPENNSPKTQSTNKNKTVGKNTIPLKDLLDNKKEKTKQNGIGPNKKDAQSKAGVKKTDKQDSSNSSSSSNISISSDEEWEREISKIVYKKPKTGSYSFLASLSSSVPILNCDMTARIFRNNYKTLKDQLLTKLFELYNEKVFDNSIPKDTILEWSDKMRGTAGFCYCKKITRRNGNVERSARIVLASKVIDSADRLRDTLIHEMCHAAAWVINCVSDGHGKYWKAWAYKAMKTFPELPPIKRCHDYVINTKYTYRCTGCGYSIGRHSKSLDVERKRCGHCYGKFEVLLNKINKKGETKAVPTPKKQPTGFALFVKENYGTYKESNLKHGDVMKILGQKFQQMKVNNLQPMGMNAVDV